MSSKLSSSLGSVSNIRFCKSAGKSMSSLIGVGTNGVFSYKVGFKQNNDNVYAFQVQFRKRSKYTNEKCKAKGATYTNWSDWFNARAISGVPLHGTQTQYPVNNWNKPNVAANKASDYVICYTFTNYELPSWATETHFQFRVRQYNKAKNRHGNWAYKTLIAKKKVDVKDIAVYENIEGGVAIYFNRKWDNTGSFLRVNSIKDSSSKEMLKKSAMRDYKVYNVASNDSHIQTRSNYDKSVVYIKGFRDVPEPDDVITCDFEFIKGRVKTDLGETTRTVQTIIAQDFGAEIVQLEFNEGTGLLRVAVSAAAGVDEANLTLVYENADGKWTLDPVAKPTSSVSTRKLFNFFPPIGVSYTLKGLAKNNASYQWVRKTFQPISRAGYRLTYKNTHNKDYITACVWGNTNFQMSIQQKEKVYQPFRRESSLIFFGEGNTRTFTLKGELTDYEGSYGGKYASKAAWEYVAEHANQLFELRTNDGYVYQVAVKQINITKKERHLYQLQVSLVEVS